MEPFQLMVELIGFPNEGFHEGGAGIGTGRYGIGGIIEILGGTITAEGGKQTGAGIGGGNEWKGRHDRDRRDDRQSSRYNRIFL